MNILIVWLFATAAYVVNGQAAYRDDYQCGPGFPAPNGLVAAECNPEGEYPCCSPYNWCGNTDAHCECSGCIDYTLPYRYDYQCGPGFAAPNGLTAAECNPEGEYPCCSPYNWCGNTDDHCECSDCMDYRLPYRDDNRCGSGFPAPNGLAAAECNPEGEYPCCSPYNWCGKTDDHCECSGCIDYRPPYREDYRCGPDYIAPNGKEAQCNPNGSYPCCSPYNWCGFTADHCDCTGCVDYRN